MKQLTILTGASRGLGLALAEQLLAAGHTLVCISRKTNSELTRLAEDAGAVLERWPLDLAQPAVAEQTLRQWLGGQSATSWSSATLINNACAIPPLLPLRDAQGDDLSYAMRVGLEAPLLLSSAFLDATRHWAANRKVLNISSGLGRRAMASQAAYCAAKAGMDHFTRCMALDEALYPNGAKVCSLAPGVIDTDMQVQLRSADSADFPDQQGFIDLQRNGQLTSPEVAASRVLAYLARADFGADPVGDVRA
jgi:NAD(P)-dependent dehydrogenase (short-subunit alcohol dehydrogenase family)